MSYSQKQQASRSHWSCFCYKGPFVSRHQLRLVLLARGSNSNAWNQRKHHGQTSDAMCMLNELQRNCTAKPQLQGQNQLVNICVLLWSPFVLLELFMQWTFDAKAKILPKQQDMGQSIGFQDHATGPTLSECQNALVVRSIHGAFWLDDHPSENYPKTRVKRSIWGGPNNTPCFNQKKIFENSSELYRTFFLCVCAKILVWNNIKSENSLAMVLFGVHLRQGSFYCHWTWMVCCLDHLILTFWPWSLGSFHSDNRRVESIHSYISTPGTSDPPTTSPCSVPARPEP